MATTARLKRAVVPSAVVGVGFLEALYAGGYLSYIILIFFLAISLPAIFVRFRSVTLTAIYRVGIPTVIATATLILYAEVHKVSEFSQYSEILRSQWAAIGAYFSIISTLYAISIAFLLWKAMTDFDHLRSILRDEANKVKSIVIFLDYFDDVKGEQTEIAVNKIKQTLSDYVARVTDFNKPDTDRLNADRLRRCIGLIERIEAPKPNDIIALENVINSLSDLIMIRSARTSALENRMSPYLFAILFMMSSCIVLMFFIFDSTQFGSTHIIIFVLSFFYSFVLILLIDLDHPFNGYWNIKIHAFGEVLEMLAPRESAQVS